ncbi:hypothetical protein [Acidicapsa acidisoli]|uniref:hypothetical protein n=1 Tax=Acidicapsa acidisoli TaxID=1615681 RepID=UPI0021E06B90|nr:hypothetical protein [Acidicapsa acidisoli]
MKRTTSARRTFGVETIEARAMGGVLIGLSVLLIAVMPWTEYYWQFDNFFHGGQDFEFGLLSTMMILCLVMLLMQLGKQDVTILLTLRRWLWIVFQHPDSKSPILLFRMVTASYAVSPPDPSSGMCDLPLRI